MKRQYIWDDIKSYCDTVSIEERNDFSDDVHIVVIGHLTYIDKLIYFYKGIKNVLFVVDEDSDPMDINKLKDLGFEVLVVSHKGSGYGNINLQCTSSLSGAKLLKDKGIKHMIRMRSDQIIVELHKFINNHKFDKLSFFSYIDCEQFGNGCQFRDTTEAYLKNVLSGVDKKVNYNNNYVMDYCITGPVDDMLKMFTYYEDEPRTVPGEHKLLLNYLLSTEMDIDNSFDYISKNFYFLLETFTKHEIRFLMFKQNYNNWSVCLKQDSPNLYQF